MSDLEKEKLEEINIINAEEKILMPGLINLHNHPCASLLKSTSRNLSLKDWVMKVAFPMITNFDNDILKFGSLYQATEMILTGTTTCLVHAVNINDEKRSSLFFRKQPN